METAEMEMGSSSCQAQTDKAEWARSSEPRDNRGGPIHGPPPSSPVIASQYEQLPAETRVHVDGGFPVSSPSPPLSLPSASTPSAECRSIHCCRPASQAVLLRPDHDIGIDVRHSTSTSPAPKTSHPAATTIATVPPLHGRPAAQRGITGCSAASRQDRVAISLVQQQCPAEEVQRKATGSTTFERIRPAFPH
ncbi:uncharacterized protein B0I36DRAFT_102758 [Microdochium trichocladiopsis]|uniref:Uncharacterized protein n=1 Tax=Microdochium trichocladiopsis TaxID=1682393 RepID=A0A9P8Y8W8_9PEZI|nr:uncharacterized protein B0I36DRAFT_102758 [Microdochium trichocladiopsis]KAH7032945.1 hypothetical protein B0I36DRAFT_102758 [Microdochium trichocladiopsis]